MAPPQHLVVVVVILSASAAAVQGAGRSRAECGSAAQPPAVSLLQQRQTLSRSAASTAALPGSEPGTGGPPAGTSARGALPRWAAPRSGAAERVRQHGSLALLGAPGSLALLSSRLVAHGTSRPSAGPALLQQKTSHASDGESWGGWLFAPKPEHMDKHQVFTYWWQSLVSVSAYLVIMLTAAYFYDKYKEPRKVPPTDGLEHTVESTTYSWRYGPFSCMGDLRICLFTMCCAPIRWADTMRMMGFFAFWYALGIWAGLAFLDALTLGTVFWGVLVMLLVYQRQQLRVVFRMDSYNSGSIFEDCVLYCCCPCCAICQEARQVELASAVDHPALRVSA